MIMAPIFQCSWMVSHGWDIVVKRRGYFDDGSYNDGGTEN